MMYTPRPLHVVSRVFFCFEVGEVLVPATQQISFPPNTFQTAVEAGFGSRRHCKLAAPNCCIRTQLNAVTRSYATPIPRAQNISSTYVTAQPACCCAMNAELCAAQRAYRHTALAELLYNESCARDCRVSSCWLTSRSFFLSDRFLSRSPRFLCKPLIRPRS